MDWDVAGVNRFLSAVLFSLNLDAVRKMSRTVGLRTRRASPEVKQS